MWGVEPLAEFLQSGHNFWNYLCGYLDVPTVSTEVVKPILKDAVYSLCYGMHQQHLRSYLTTEFKNLGLPEKSVAFVTEPYLHMMFQAREQEIERITNAGTVNTCFAKPLTLRNDFRARDALAQMARAWEMKIILPAFRLAMENQEEFKIMLYQFDGFSVHFTRRPEEWRKRIETVVNDQAEALRIPTRLEWDRSGVGTNFAPAEHYH